MPQHAKHQLLGRTRELEALDRLLREVRDGRSQVLVLRGEAGVGKSALLDHLAGQAAQLQTVRAAGVEAESDFAYSALQRLCVPLLSHLDRLPAVQQDALRVAFGLSAGNPPEMLLVGIAVLGLFAEAAAQSPLVCLVDDAQWLDLMSHRILAFVGRRLDAESVALVFAERITGARRKKASPVYRTFPCTGWPTPTPGRCSTACCRGRSTPGCGTGSSPRPAGTRSPCWSCPGACHRRSWRSASEDPVPARWRAGSRTASVGASTRCRPTPAPCCWSRRSNRSATGRCCGVRCACWASGSRLRHRRRPRT